MQERKVGRRIAPLSMTEEEAQVFWELIDERDSLKERVAHIKDELEERRKQVDPAIAALQEEQAAAKRRLSELTYDKLHHKFDLPKRTLAGCVERNRGLK